MEVETLSERSKGKVRWFNATEGSGFVTPNSSDGYLYFHQSSLKSDGHDGYHGLNIDDSVEFEFRPGWDGCPRAFDITAPNGGMLTGGFHANEGDCSVRYSGHGDPNCSVGDGYGGGHNGGYEEVAALPMVFEGTTLQVFDEMPFGNVIWDEELPQSIDPCDGLLQQLVEGREFKRSHEIMRECSRAPASCELISGDGYNLTFLSPGTAHKVSEEMPSLNVVWDDNSLHNFESETDLLKQLAQGGTHFVDGDQELIGNLYISGEITHVSGVHLHMDVSEVLDMTLEDEVTTQSVVWDEELPSDFDDGHNNLLKRLAFGNSCCTVKKANLVDVSEEIHEAYKEQVLADVTNFDDKSLHAIDSHAGWLELMPKSVQCLTCENMKLVIPKLVNVNGFTQNQGVRKWKDKFQCRAMRTFWGISQIEDPEFSSLDENLVKYELCAAHFQLSSGGFILGSNFNQLVIEKFQARRYGGFSPAERDKQLEIYTSANFSIKQWDPGIQFVLID